MNDTDQARRWCSLSIPEVSALLTGNDAGLDSADAGQRLSRYGPNALPSPRMPGFPHLFLRQFISPLIYVLLAAMVVSAVVGNPADATFIGLILLLNALIGALQEHQAQRSAQALRKLMVSHARVLRDEKISEIPAHELVPGDLVLLTSGDRVPADLRLLNSVGLEVDESVLTGESLPVFKNSDRLCEVDTPVAEQVNTCFAGTLVTAGRGRGLVTTTGMHTEMGKLSLTMESAQSARPPLFQRIERFSKKLMIALLFAVVLLAAIELARDTEPLVIFMTAVALAVSAIPEGLPMALTLVLSIGTRRMVKRHVIVRKLVAVESLGSCTVIATDKTGTLTENHLTAREMVFCDERSVTIDGGKLPSAANAPRHNNSLVIRLARVAALCNEAELRPLENGEWHSSGDAVDQALLVMAHKVGLQRHTLSGQWPLMAEVHYEPALGFAATLHGKPQGAGSLVCVKGALEKLLPMCDRMATADGDTSLDAAQVLSAMSRLAEQGARVLAFADGEGSAPEHFTAENLRGLCMLGLVAMFDPLRAGAADAVAECRAAGIRVCMLTGDHPRTALRIAQELRLADRDDNPVTGTHLAQAEARGPEALDALTADTRVYARVSPEQKLSIVQSLQRQGQFVAVTGDGVNDAPALSRAHVGVAMGEQGTEVAKESADLLLTDDNFASVVAGVEEGRIAYQNIRKVIFFLISTGAAEVMLFVLTTAFGLPLPLTPVQLLWLNLVTNSVQSMGLALEPGEGDEMRKPPRPPKESLFNPVMLRRVLVSGMVMGGLAFTCFYWLLQHGWEVDAARNSVLLLMVLFENVQVFNSRSETRSIFRQPFFSNPVLLLGTLFAQGLHILCLYSPLMQEVLGVSPVSAMQWSALLSIALLQLLAMELLLCWTRGWR
ncbi:cation-translocating P-type ATPase [Microbulbifer hydrolyticus]|uniref:Ca2+-transporting ATPase n=1 Tax=Microbulbifer hydrolyticus TaxID=48074 RepID=A0A6P1TBE4_9GAMM|nr:HAD-IC family P-type ATPase [Microbulbifer hydrolyticus]MBB5210404.1 Ca2+-transporting ATPase [Microbulbifer hydrolyticus]QHQ39111.1 HAD-IC family P-type ATPase [Microbulbifer hydrolyticus]